MPLWEVFCKMVFLLLLLQDRHENSSQYREFKEDFFKEFSSGLSCFWVFLSMSPVAEIVFRNLCSLLNLFKGGLEKEFF